HLVTANLHTQQHLPLVDWGDTLDSTAAGGGVRDSRQQVVGPYLDPLQLRAPFVVSDREDDPVPTALDLQFPLHPIRLRHAEYLHSPRSVSIASLHTSPS